MFAIFPFGALSAFMRELIMMHSTVSFWHCEFLFFGVYRSSWRHARMNDFNDWDGKHWDWEDTTASSASRLVLNEYYNAAFSRAYRIALISNHDFLHFHWNSSTALRVVKVFRWL
jgi:mannosyltransferase OCH1-like enzyme